MDSLCCSYELAYKCNLQSLEDLNLVTLQGSSAVSRTKTMVKCHQQHIYDTKKMKLRSLSLFFLFSVDSFKIYWSFMAF